MSGVDTFIEALAQLLLACPSTTLLITYANRTKKSKKTKTNPTDGASKAPLNVVKFKCFDPTSGRVTKYSTSKAKELSRLLAFVGPRGVLVTSKSKSVTNPDSSSSLTTSHTAGLASIMTNVRFEETDTAPVASVLIPESKDQTPVPSNDASGALKAKKKNKKKKGKK